MNTFCYRMRSGDLVILSISGSRRMVMEVAGDYEFMPTLEEPPIGDYQHQRRAMVRLINPDELWKNAGGMRQGSPYAPLIECSMPIDVQTKATTGLEGAGNTEYETTALAAEDYISADEVDANTVYQEGAARQVMVNAYERSPNARLKCITHYGLQCCICKFDFERFYGEAGAGYIHVHHLRPLADIGVQYEVNPITDLRPVCANCHSIIHRHTLPYSIEEVKAMLKTQAS